jgi:hypothetical protein
MVAKAQDMEAIVEDTALVAEDSEAMVESADHFSQSR